MVCKPSNQPTTTQDIKVFVRRVYQRHITTRRGPKVTWLGILGRYRLSCVLTRLHSAPNWALSHTRYRYIYYIISVRLANSHKRKGHSGLFMLLVEQSICQISLRTESSCMICALHGSVCACSPTRYYCS